MTLADKLNQKNYLVLEAVVENEDLRWERTNVWFIVYDPNSEQSAKVRISSGDELTKDWVPHRFRERPIGKYDGRFFYASTLDKLEARIETASQKIKTLTDQDAPKAVKGGGRTAVSRNRQVVRKASARLNRMRAARWDSVNIR